MQGKLALCACNHRFVTVTDKGKLMATSEKAREKEIFIVSCSFVLLFLSRTPLSTLLSPTYSLFRCAAICQLVRRQNGVKKRNGHLVMSKALKLTLCRFVVDEVMCSHHLSISIEYEIVSVCPIPYSR